MNTSSNKALKILLVKDEAIARLVNCRFLEELGYHPNVAENGQAAIDMAANLFKSSIDGSNIFLSMYIPC